MQADDDIDAIAKERLGKAVQSARLGDTGKELAYGNKAGRGVLGDIHEMKEMMKRMQSQLQNQSLKFVEHQAQLVDTRRPPGPNRSSPTSRRYPH
ncbi:uncharacterized protein K441DRAFT_270706 [Cenococcum geophilum 1.58]|uniref:uncharacterized protein n=1 Tax=Cenococcum geophilum 1.58 TaxID=794803 RepID=UPI00358E8839|nr:hypothetical protein K441DRAFT_270706 [Cenococcum geophilum 1.58]